MRMSQQQYADYLSRQQSAKLYKQADTVSSGIEKEADLHALILNHCKQRGWIALHGSMAHRTYRTEGEPDFCILADQGRVLWIECKTKTGKLSQEQLGFSKHAEMLGHQVHVVRSYEEYINVITK